MLWEDWKPERETLEKVLRLIEKDGVGKQEELGSVTGKERKRTKRLTETEKTNDLRQDSAHSLPAPSLFSINQLPAPTGNPYTAISSFT